MRLSTMFFLVALGITATFGAGRPAYARTPTPASTPTPTAAPAPPQPAMFTIRPWLNAQNRGQVTARIGGTLCATGVAFTIPSDPEPRFPSVQFTVSIPSEETVPGCGREGATVTFFIDGQRAWPTAAWHSGDNGVFGVIAGPPFADFVIISGEAEQTSRAGGSLVPYIGGKPCGYGAVVYSNEQQAGCGVEGSQITFNLFDRQGNLIGTANEKGTWHAWDGLGDHLQQLTLTFAPVNGITMGNTGSGGGSQGGTTAWGIVVIALCGVGLGGIGTGAALRGRTTTR